MVPENLLLTSISLGEEIKVQRGKKYFWNAQQSNTDLGLEWQRDRKRKREWQKGRKDGGNSLWHSNYIPHCTVLLCKGFDDKMSKIYILPVNFKTKVKIISELLFLRMKNVSPILLLHQPITSVVSTLWE